MTGRVWLASVCESAWHVAAHTTGAPVAACGHRLRGTVHGRRGAEPPTDGARQTCPACLQAIDYVPPTRPYRPLPQTWPGIDPDAPTKRRRSLAEPLEAFPHESPGEPLTGEPPPDPLEALDEFAA